MLRILVPVTPDEYNLIRHDLAAKKKKGEEMEVTIRLQGFGSQTWTGRVSHVPIAFWYLSLTGGLLMTIYGVLRGDPVIVLGQAPGLVVYIRNLMLISKRARLSRGQTPT